ncbi:MAG: hypothetical protein DNFNHJIP_00516 [Candidatus Argoarchaeum ethanivorans]|uniref:Uncharacterized protein n=1 Tax=Candidatus Argoarchaeum ethanivorans TaxID=2608793 RepID=A0A812A2G0_9EURY|nr:MAG: hypothetical protein DNFNHJIP_00516 [Candidatus Argoarchaeum ethanivorans]
MAKKRRKISKKSGVQTRGYNTLKSSNLWLKYDTLKKRRLRRAGIMTANMYKTVGRGAAPSPHGGRKKQTKNRVNLLTGTIKRTRSVKKNLTKIQCQRKKLQRVVLFAQGKIGGVGTIRRKIFNTRKKC